MKTIPYRPCFGAASTGAAPQASRAMIRAIRRLMESASGRNGLLSSTSMGNSWRPWGLKTISKNENFEPEILMIVIILATCTLATWILKKSSLPLPKVDGVFSLSKSRTIPLRVATCPADGCDPARFSPARIPVLTDVFCREKSGCLYN